MVLHLPQRGEARPFSVPYALHLVQRARVAADLQPHITLEACRHGGLTELGDAGLCEQEVMAHACYLMPI